jgi:hypothetical protein
MSQKVVDLFKKYRVTGFEAVPVKTSYPKRIKALPPHLFELVVTGWAAEAAGVSLTCSCPACGMKKYVIRRAKAADRS